MLKIIYLVDGEDVLLLQDQVFDDLLALTIDELIKPLNLGDCKSMEAASYVRNTSRNLRERYISRQNRE
jgi:hypothetical protein